MSKTEGIEGRWAEVDGLRIHYFFADGPGPAVLLVPGGMVDSAMLTWKYVWKGLRGRCRMYVPELPGYGESDKPEAPYTTEYYIDVLSRFIRSLGEQRVILCGSSMAGAIVLGVALSRPEMVQALVLSGGFGVQDRVPLHELVYLLARIPRIEDLIRHLSRAHPLFLRLALPIAVWNLDRIDSELVHDSHMGVDDRRALEAFKRWMMSDILPHRVRSNFTSELHRLRMPVLLIHGEHDLMMPVRYTRRASHLIPDAELHVFPSGHLVPREWPDQVVDVIREFIQGRVPVETEPL